ncbi:uncharacterized protein LOC144122825 [Amblyomma americanum]
MTLVEVLGSTGLLPAVSQVIAPSTPTPATLHNPKVPVCFRGNAFEDVEEWLDQFERVAKFNQWSANQKLCNIYFALLNNARTWFKNHETSLSTWNDFRRQLVDTFSCPSRRENALRLLEVRIQKLNESFAMFAADMARLFRRADPDMTEQRKLRHLMHGVKEQVLAGLGRNPPQSVSEFVKDAIAIERALQGRCRLYDRLFNGVPTAAAALTATDRTTLREFIREIELEELQRITATSVQSPQAVSVAVRKEQRYALSPSLPYNESHPVDNAAAIVNQTTCHNHAPPSSTSRQQRRFFQEPQWAPPGRSQPRRTDMWRSYDRRPLCFFCGQPGHVY